MGAGGSGGTTGWRLRRARAGTVVGRVGAGRRRLRPAGDTCSGARSVVGHAPASAGLGATFGRIGDAELGQHVLKAVVAQHRALEPGRADLDAEQVEQVVGAEGLDLGERLALDLVGQERALAWLIAQPRPVNPTRPRRRRVTPSWSVIRSPHSGLLPSKRRVGVLDDPEVVGPPVVLEDVVAVEVVHRPPECSASSNPDQRGRIWRTRPARGAGTHRTGAPGTVRSDARTHGSWRLSSMVR